jgi:hypothetical protein
VQATHETRAERRDLTPSQRLHPESGSLCWICEREIEADSYKTPRRRRHYPRLMSRLAPSYGLDVLLLGCHHLAFEPVWSSKETLFSCCRLLNRFSGAACGGRYERSWSRSRGELRRPCLHLHVNQLLEKVL